MTDSIASALDGYGRAKKAAEGRAASKARPAKKPQPEKALDSVKLLRAKFRVGLPEDNSWQTMPPLE